MQIKTTLVGIDQNQSIQPNPQAQKKVKQIVEIPKPKIDIKQSCWQQNKVKILSATALLAICSIGYAVMKWYDKTHWIQGSDGSKCPAPDLSDDFNSYYCAKGQWIVIEYFPIEKFCGKAKACSLGEKITGCIDGKYFHHLSKECLRNPNGHNCKYTSPWEVTNIFCSSILDFVQI